MVCANCSFMILEFLIFKPKIHPQVAAADYFLNISGKQPQKINGICWPTRTKSFYNYSHDNIHEDFYGCFERALFIFRYLSGRREQLALNLIRDSLFSILKSPLSFSSVMSWIATLTKWLVRFFNASNITWILDRGNGGHFWACSWLKLLPWSKCGKGAKVV